MKELSASNRLVLILGSLDEDITFQRMYQHVNWIRLIFVEINFHEINFCVDLFSNFVIFHVNLLS